MKYKCVIFDVGYTLVEHNDKKETEMISKLLNIPYSEDLVNEISNFWKKSAEYTKEIIVSYDKFKKPNILIRLKCNQDERVRRIEQRNSSDFDDKTLTRAIKYNWVSDQIISKIGLNHIDINTSNKTIDEIYSEVNKYINQAFDFTNNEIER